MPFRPLKDRILVKPADRKMGEVLTVISSEKFNLGHVVAVGPKVDSLRVGDQIRFGESKETSISFPKYYEAGEEFLVLQEADVCFVEESTN